MEEEHEMGKRGTEVVEEGHEGRKDMGGGWKRDMRWVEEDHWRGRRGACDR